jgi:flagellar biosynthesis chaperone FliJ
MKAEILQQFMTRANRFLRLVELKAPSVILAHEIRSIKTTITELEEQMADPTGWTEVIEAAHEKYVAGQEQLEEWRKQDELDEAMKS